MSLGPTSRVGAATPAPLVRRGGSLATPLVSGLLRDGVAVRLVAEGHSMTPFIRRGDTVTVRPRGDRRTRPGMVLAIAVEPRRLVVHRQVGWCEDGIVTRGDCAPEPDPAVPPADVVGVVTGVERRGSPVWAGLGAGGRAIALLSRLGLLRRLARLLSGLR